MEKDVEVNEREKKLNGLKLMLNEIDGKLLSITEELNWDYTRLLQEKPSNMVICSVNSQHRVPLSKIKIHEEKCAFHHSGYTDSDKIFPEHSGCGSFVTLTPELMNSIIENVSSKDKKTFRSIPQTSENFDQNFDREEKLALYNYVVANTQNQKPYSDLWLQPLEKKEEKKEMSSWEIAAAERDAKRRRASYRNKVHTNRKTHTEILREVIESQMEAFKEDNLTETSKNKYKRDKTDNSKIVHERRHSEEKSKYRNEGSSRHRDRENKDKRKDYERHSKYSDRSYKRSPSITGSDFNSRSRSDDKYRKWKTYKGRSYSHKSSKY